MRRKDGFQSVFRWVVMKGYPDIWGLRAISTTREAHCVAPSQHRSLTTATPSINSPLLSHIKAKILMRGGPISISEYMQDCLTSPHGGYYMGRDVFGRTGDFITSPEISQMFGEMVGIWCVHTWLGMGRPPRLMVVELGPGRGTLMADLLRGTAAFREFSSALEVHLVEVSPALRGLQWRTLSCTSCWIGEGRGGAGGRAEAAEAGMAQAPPQAGICGFNGCKVFWHNSLDAVPEGPGPALYIAHEFFDALPVHQFVRDSRRGWLEKMVDVELQDGAAEGLEEAGTKRAAGEKGLGVKVPEPNEGNRSGGTMEESRPVLLGLDGVPLRTPSVASADVAVARASGKMEAWSGIMSTLDSASIPSTGAAAAAVSSAKAEAQAAVAEANMAVEAAKAAVKGSEDAAVAAAEAAGVKPIMESVAAAPSGGCYRKDQQHNADRNYKSSRGCCSVGTSNGNIDDEDDGSSSVGGDKGGGGSSARGAANGDGGGEDATQPPKSSTRGAGLRLVLSPGPTPASALLVARRLAGLAAEEAEKITAVEISAVGMATAERLAQRIARSGGAALIIDYGREAPPYGDSLVAIREHRGVGILDSPGTADLSAWVDFGALRLAATGPGGPIATSGPVAQGAFLRALGIETRLAALVTRASSPQEAEGLVAGVQRLVGSGPADMGSPYQVMAIQHESLGELAGLGLPVRTGTGARDGAGKGTV